MFRNRGLGGKIIPSKPLPPCENIVMNRSELVEHDVNVRQTWSALVSPEGKAKLKAVAQPARLALYKDIDAKIKTKYLETLQTLNQELDVIQLKGFGPLRQAKNQQPLDQVLAGVAQDVLSEIGYL